MTDIYDAEGQVDRDMVIDHADAIISGCNISQRDALIDLLDELIGALPADHECIGQEESEHMHDVAMWERQWGKRRPEPPVMADCDPGYDRDMLGPSL